VEVSTEDCAQNQDLSESTNPDFTDVDLWSEEVDLDSELPPDNSASIACRHTLCVELSADDPDDAEALIAGYSYKAEGRRLGANGQCGEVVTSHFLSQDSCLAIAYKKLPIALFYGNLGTWGWLGLDDQARLYGTVDEVVAKFETLCQQTRTETGLGEHLKCHADLIGYAVVGYIRATQEVAHRLIEEQDATITIDIRTRPEKPWSFVQQIVSQIFSGNTTVVSKEFLQTHPIGLSLDLEPQLDPGEGSYYSVPAWVANWLCNTHRDLMISYGHDPNDLICFLYEYANPTMVGDGENLEPYILPVLMTIVDKYRVMPGTHEELVQKALALKELWIDETNRAYPLTDITGCMFFTAPYLTLGQRDYFTFEQAWDAFGDKCDIHAFQ